MMKISQIESKSNFMHSQSIGVFNRESLPPIFKESFSAPDSIQINNKNPWVIFVSLDKTALDALGPGVDVLIGCKAVDASA